nr:hypothetical protein B0A51_11542 [Rachicladosporium sp. CCFEE 5018]
MNRSIPILEDYAVSPLTGFLSSIPPLQRLPNSYYAPWERIVADLQGLILSKRLRGVVDDLPVLSTNKLTSEPEWRRAYSILAFITHAYIWCGPKPASRIPPPVTIPFKQTCAHLELPTVASYAAVVLWNWKPIFPVEESSTLANLDMLHTFTGSLDEKWFYLVSVAFEARGAAAIPLMLDAISAARTNNVSTVTAALRSFAEILDDLGMLLSRMAENCDPYVFYNRIRPFLAGSKNMGDAGLPNGVIFDDGGPMYKQRFVQYAGGSNAQSSIFQFFDLVLGVEHRVTGTKPSTDSAAAPQAKKSVPSSANFIHDMRRYMPGPHARFLAHVAEIANLRSFVDDHASNAELSVAFDACLAMLSALRDQHIQIVSRYILIPSAAAKKAKAAAVAAAEKQKAKEQGIELALRPAEKKTLRGTGGSALIPFLRQARDETSEPAVQGWVKRLLSKEKGDNGKVLDAAERMERKSGCPGLAGVWSADEGDSGGLCYV